MVYNLSTLGVILALFKSVHEHLDVVNVYLKP